MVHTLTHYPLCPFSRSVRLALAELEIEVALCEERPWEWRPAFLALNPSGEVPVLQLDDGSVLAGVYAISEYLDEAGRNVDPDLPDAVLFPGTAQERAETRRLVDWFHHKLDREVTQAVVEEKLLARIVRGTGRAPQPDVLRAARANLRHHLSYVAYLTDQRGWLAGRQMSFADLAAAAHLSCLDYLDEVPWNEQPTAKSWYARLKSRRSFQPLLADRVVGVAPPAAYEDLDF